MIGWALCHARWEGAYVYTFFPKDVDAARRAGDLYQRLIAEHDAWAEEDRPD